MTRDALTLRTVVDLLIEGHVLKALDVAVQRVKSLEMMSKGTSARKLELGEREFEGRKRQGCEGKGAKRKRRERRIEVAGSSSEPNLKRATSQGECETVKASACFKT